MDDPEPRAIRRILSMATFTIAYVGVLLLMLYSTPLWWLLAWGSGVAAGVIILLIRWINGRDDLRRVHPPHD